MARFIGLQRERFRQIGLDPTVRIEIFVCRQGGGYRCRSRAGIDQIILRFAVDPAGMEQHFLRAAAQFQRRCRRDLRDRFHPFRSLDPESGPEQDHAPAVAAELPELFQHNRMQCKEIRHDHRLIGGVSQFVLFALHQAEPRHVILRTELKLHMLTDQMQGKFRKLIVVPLQRSAAAVELRVQRLVLLTAGGAVVQQPAGTDRIDDQRIRGTASSGKQLNRPVDPGGKFFIQKVIRRLKEETLGMVPLGASGSGIKVRVRDDQVDPQPQFHADLGKPAADRAAPAERGVDFRRTQPFLQLIRHG